MEQEQEEAAEQQQIPHRDFYNVRKVDTHVHLAAAMNQKHLLRFIKRKMRYHPDEVVTKSSSGEPMTLSEVFEELNLTPYDLSIDALGMHTDSNTFARFDKFNLSTTRSVSRSCARSFSRRTCWRPLLCRDHAGALRHLAFSKYQKAEYRISIYGRSKKEWDDLASWVVDHQLYSNHNRWLIQIPRLYGMYQSNRLVRTFAEMLDNIFTPLFEVSVDLDASQAACCCSRLWASTPSTTSRRPRAPCPRPTRRRSTLSSGPRTTRTTPTTASTCTPTCRCSTGCARVRG